MAEDKKGTRVAVYGRVSSEEQKQKQTIENQIAFAKQYCKLREHRIVASYLDEGVSGTTPIDDRPEGTKLLRDAHQGKFDQVLVYRLDRLARSTRNLLEVHDELQELNTTLVSMTESFDTSTPTGKMVLTMLGAIAALERDTIAERTSLGKIRHVKEGKWPGGRPPLGYRVNEHGFAEIDDAEAKTVRWIFQRYVEEGLSSMAIARQLSARGAQRTYQRRGVKMKTHPKWGNTDVIHILQSPTYMGTFQYRRRHKGRVIEAIEIKMPAIISKELWKKAARQRKKNMSRASRNAKRLYLLRGLIRCGLCGRLYVGDGNYNRGCFYYRCTNNTSFRGIEEEKCHAKLLRAPEIEDIVWQDITGFLKNPDEVLEQLETRLKAEMKKETNTEAQFADASEVIASKRKERERVLGLYRRGIIGDQEVEHQLRELQGEIEALRSDQERLFGKREAFTQLRTRTINAETLLKSLRKKLSKADENTKRELMEALVERIVVDTTEEGSLRRAEVTITYLFDKPPAGSSKKTPDYYRRD